MDLNKARSETQLWSFILNQDYKEKTNRKRL